ncbi:MAG: energy-coupling factor ABC transporter ATP-binding protein [Thermosphaera sp.]
MNEIVASDLAIGYDKSFPLLKNLDFKLTNGVYVLLGANGSGKSTLLKTIAGLLPPLQGEIYVNGFKPYLLKRKEAAKLIGYVWQNPFHGFVEPTVEREILFISKQTGVEVNWKLIHKLVPLELFERSPFTLSGGEAKRVSLASVIALDQPIWLLDEPFNELDFSGVKIFTGIINYARARGKIVVITTHYPSLADLVKPDYYLLINRSSGTLVIDKWSNLSDEELVGNEVIPRVLKSELTD